MKLSLLNLLLLLTTLATIIGLFASWQTNSSQFDYYEKLLANKDKELQKLEKELAAIRQEAGMLTVSDRRRIYAVKLRTNIENTWSYRVFLPQGHDYYFTSKINQLPSEEKQLDIDNPPGTSTVKGLPDNGVAIGRPPGEYIVTLSLVAQNEKWKHQLNIRESGKAASGITGGSVLRCTENEWPNQKDWRAESGVTNQVDVFVEDGLMLLDLRAGDSSIPTSNDTDQGAMLWVGVAD